MIDQTPASFWVTHPDNTFIGNHAAGSEHYGFWFDLQKHPTGPSADTNVCPRNAKLGEFDSNVSHSNNKYGLRIHDTHLPRTYPCLSMLTDPTDSANPHILANYKNHLSYKNRKNGVIAEEVGYVQFTDAIVADNAVAGLEVSLTDKIDDGYAMIAGATIIGRSDNAEEDFVSSSSPQYGVITPRSENFSIKDTKFFDFNWSDDREYAAIGTCSHCFHGASTDSGARTVTVSGLEFDNVE